MDRMLWALFSKPLYRADINVSNTDLSKVKWVPNQENWVSEDLNILNTPEFATIAAQLHAVIAEYFHGVMKVNSDTELFITESWLNKTETGQKHHRHWHPNSVLSGILYLSSEGTTGKTVFIDKSYDLLEFNYDDANVYNSKTWAITPHVGDVLVFPSSVEHMVEEYHGQTPRITLAFNTFVRGSINSNPLRRLEL